MLQRVLEPEVMDTAEDALDYDRMDHGDVNRAFVSDFLAAAQDLGEVLDLGTGTAQIPIELCRHSPDARVWAIDLSAQMLYQARANVEVAGFTERIKLDRNDAKALPYADGRFTAVMSNSIVHHIPDPMPVLAEAIRVLRPGGIVFVRDLTRPASAYVLQALVDTYAAGANDHQRTLFGDSLAAALSLDEIQTIVAGLGFDPSSVEATSDRHWTWCVRKPA